MNRYMFAFILTLIIAIGLASCGSSDTGSPETATGRTGGEAAATLPPPVVVASETDAAPAAAPEPTAAPPMPAPTADPALAPFVGTYQFRPGETEETADYFLVLNADGTFEVDEQLVGSDEQVVEATGLWTAVGDEVVLAVTTIYDEPVAEDFFVRIVFSEGFPIITDAKVGDQFVHLDDTGFNIGAGERSALINELNRRLAAVDYLNYTDPNSDLYTEEVRKAVVAFQESQGLLPDGVLTAETWLALENPAAPVPTPTPLPPPLSAPITTIPDLSQLPDQTEDGQPILYLTFDDGPLPDYTSPLLDVLERYGAVVTFFNLGQNVATWPETVREATTRGHYIANHTWDHASLEGMTPEQFVSEVERTNQAIINAAGDLFSLDLNVRYVRPPYGATDANTRQYAANEGMAVVLWDIDTQDWRQPGAEIIADHLVSSAFPGAIVLMHDGGGERDQTIAALELALPRLQQQGYVFRNIFVP